MKKAYLILQNGKIMEGISFGYDRESVGELVFTTGMNGYIETLTDPSYFGQIVIQTFPMIGNYGMIPADFEGKCAVKGYIVRDYCDEPSNFRKEYSLQEFLLQNKIPALCGIDTRELTKIIRAQGVCNAKIAFSEKINFSELTNYTVKNAVESVSIKQIKKDDFIGKYKVALIDYGAKKNIKRELHHRNCSVDIYPNFVRAEEILSGHYDGVMLSNGPGDPAENIQEIAQIKKLIGKIPLFGICLGHQLTALALGGKTQKLQYGHRGVNQPVKCLDDNRTYITSQNHGYAVVGESIKAGRVNYLNANDGTCEGIDYPSLQAFTVQFHPEAASGPKDASFLFDKFISLMEKNHA